MKKYASTVDEAEHLAARDCGLSDVLYEIAVQGAYRQILADAPDEDKAELEAYLKQRGYLPNFKPWVLREGECHVTGLHEDYCACGRHP